MYFWCCVYSRSTELFLFSMESSISFKKGVINVTSEGFAYIFASYQAKLLKETAASSSV